MYLYYIMWQWLAYKKGKSLHKTYKFSLCHHVTWGSIQLGSFMYKIAIPFIFGPAGGGQKSSVAFKKYFGSAWAEEEKREKISKLMFKFNPACKTMLKKAKSILVSNPDTANAVKAQGLTNYISALDAALPLDFFPENFKTKELKQNTLNLLWVGRFLPRKGILLILEVMEKLKSFPGIKLTVVGDGQQRDLFLESIKEKELEKNVIWEGNIPFNEVKTMYQNHDVFFFTSLRDSGPTQLVEAMAYGMPVVTINIHGQSFIVSDKTGFRCGCETPEQAIEELYNSILKLYNNQELVTSMSREANSFALKQTWQNKIKTVIEQSYPI
ncbi:MAG: glycosyltransferase [Pedobacter sp.]|nr:MAG: glycosyltransferase [Pedobacter sp.]